MNLEGGFRSATYPQHFILLPVKDMCCKCSVCPEPLSADRSAKPAVMFCHISNQITLRIHNHVSVCLLKAQEQIHHLDLSLYNEARVCQELRCRMLRLDDRPFIFRNIHRRKEIVMRRICPGEGF